jgi:REP element-mobilizing transposase RayT
MLFCEINKEKINYSLLGEAARQGWLEIPKHFPSVILDEFVIMPNHVHGIIIIRNDVDNRNDVTVGTQNLAFPSESADKSETDDEWDDVTDDDGTQDFAFLRETTDETTCGNKFGPQSKNLGSVIRGFKIGVTKFATINNLFFAWQPRFHDRIIRDEDELNRIRQYIVYNPLNWSTDRNNLK